MKSYLLLSLWIIIYLGVSFGIGQVAQGEIDLWYQTLEKPSLNPPNWVFPVMWTFLYITIAVAGWRLWLTKNTPTLKILFVGYTALNWAWTPIFFGLHAIEIGFGWIMAINIVNLVFITKAWSVNRISAYFMIPVFLWTVFAAYLNYSIWMLNGA